MQRKLVGVPSTFGRHCRSQCFMVFHKDQFLVPCSLTDICNSADDTVIFACVKNLNNVIAGLENDSSIITQWLADNLMK